jgi:hypothetical protein
MPPITIKTLPLNGSIGYAPDGQPIASLFPIGPLGGGVLVAGGAADIPISDTGSSGPPAETLIAKLQRIKMICTIAPGAPGVAVVKNKPTPPPPPPVLPAPITLVSIDILATYAAGQVIEIAFDTPLTSEVDNPFVIDMPAGAGTWRVYAMGYFLNAGAV